MSPDTVGNTFTMTFELKVFDNFLPQKHFQELVEYIDNCAWHYNSMIVYDKSNTNPEDKDYVGPDTPNEYQMVMPIWSQGWVYERYIVELFSTYLEPRAWVRIKANFSPKRIEIIENDLHIDTNHGDFTAIFYINSNDGYSHFKSGKRVESVANRIVIFPRDTMHSGTTSTTDHRKVINFNYFGSVAE